MSYKLKLELIGGFCSATAVYLWFFDKIPFGAPWGFFFAGIAGFCLKLYLKEMYGDN